MTDTSAAAPSAPTSAPQQPPVAPPDAGAADTPPPDATPAEIRKWKVKVDGTEAEVDETELLRGYERSKGAHKRFEEAARERKAVEAEKAEIGRLYDMIRKPETRDRALTKLLGGEAALYELAESVLIRKLEHDALPEPERKRRAQMTERERAIEAEEQRIAAREEAIRRKNEEATNARAKELQQGFLKEWPELLKRAGVPSSRIAINRMASTMREAISNGLDMTAQEAAEIVAEELRAEYRDLASSADPDTLTRLLGDGAEKVRAASLAKVQAQPGRTAPKEQPTRASGGQYAPAPVRLSMEELRKRWQR